MSKKHIYILIFFITVTIGVTITVFQKNSSGPIYKVISFDEVELADEPIEHSQGLMNRDELCPKCGMLFVFEKSANRSFWMKNTTIPLDIIFVDNNNQIQKIYSNTNPLQTNPSYSSIKPIKYVLETNSFYTKHNNLQEGDYIDIEYLQETSIPFQNSKK
ncbi:DUF192 domain-containing protein [Candidatus Gracilibacteria bacterium]|nr:DUF192 domain-containing protein [Candidatus Gracilibacteria bacterium]NJS41721.1 DUF192 domain-containing protein [Candidatus Gracilibacteria bacterium]